MIAVTKEIRRKVTTARGEPLVIIIAPEGIYFREPRRRMKLLLPFGVAFVKAAQLSVADKPKRKRNRSARLSRRGI